MLNVSLQRFRCFIRLSLAAISALAMVGCLGLLLHNRASLKTLLPASFGALRHLLLITNAFSWLSDPGYVKSFAG